MITSTRSKFTVLFTGTSALALTALAFSAAPFVAGNGVPNTFQAGTPARADEVNQNFEALCQRIDALEAQVATLQEKTQFFVVDANDVEGMTGPNLLIEGANVHVRSGSGATNDGGSLTGRGNLVVGYSELGSLTSGDRVGSHNFILGSRNTFTSFGGIVAGSDNQITNESASVTGGQFNVASGLFASIAGGGGATQNLTNEAAGDHSTLSGGFRNEATGDQSAISGGSGNVASGFLSSVAGGTSNVASGAGATVSGGASNDAIGSNAAISGGQGGRASGVASSVTGGLNRSVTANFDCVDCNG